MAQGSGSRTPYYKANLLWPVTWLGGRLWASSLVERYDAAMRHLLLTPEGTLYYAPTYGSTIHLLRTQNMQREPGGRIDEALARLRMAVQQFIPDVQVIDLKAELHEDEQRLRVSCVWIIRDASPLMHGELADQQATTVLL